ncbi:MAG: hypothetical protein ABSE63_09785 [Thermoguttaceae bacterium]
MFSHFRNHFFNNTFWGPVCGLEWVAVLDEKLVPGAMSTLAVGMWEVQVDLNHGHASVAMAPDGFFGSKCGARISIEKNRPILLGKQNALTLALSRPTFGRCPERGQNGIVAEKIEYGVREYGSM